MNSIRLYKSDTLYPSALGHYLGQNAPETIWAIGNLEILRNKKTALFCSSRCPGDLIIKTYDLAKKWRDDGVTVISGFHSPMEQECLTILLRGKQPVIVCPARSVETMRLRAEYKKLLAEGRLLFLSPFPAKEKRMTVETATIRNRFVAALADEVFVAHAAPGGKTEHLCREAREWGKVMRTLGCEANSHLLALGAGAISHEGVA